MLSGFRAAFQEKGMPLAIICFLSVALGFSIAANIYNQAPAVAVAAAAGKLGSDWRTAFEDIAEKLAPSVVKIESEKNVQVPNMFPDMDDSWPFGGKSPFRMPDDQPRVQPQHFAGSGVIVRSDGYILTNSHVVADMDRVTVQLSDGREFKGKVLLDRKTDLALVKIEASGLAAAELADSDQVKVGQWAVAIGNPFGLKNTVTVGVVSAFRKTADEAPVALVATEVIQTDASINPGNSGGPLVDLDGRVMGINFMILSRSGGHQGVGFAIPSNTAKFVMGQLIEKGRVVRGYLGVDFGDLTPNLSEKWGVKHGALVNNVYKDSPAEKAGLQVKDVITEVNGKPVTSGIDLRNAIQTTAPGTTVKVTIVRDKKEKTLSIKLEEMKDEQTASGKSEAEDKFGVSAQPLTAETAKALGVDADVKGVVVRKVEPGSAADRAGIQPKDIITEIDDAPITSVASFSKAIKALKSGDTAIVVIQRGDRSTIVEVPID